MKKSQAAMEFLLTYGWVILIVLAAITALSYFGVTKPDKFLPEMCVLEQGMNCADFKIKTDRISVFLVNSLGKDVIIHDILIGGCSSSFDLMLDNGDSSLFELVGCSNGAVGLRFKGDIVIDYEDSRSFFNKTINGNIAGMIE